MYNRAFNCLSWSGDRSLGDTHRLLATHVIYHSFNLYPNHYLRATNVHFSCHFCADRRRGGGVGGGDFGLKTKSQIEHCLFLSSLHDLSRVGEKRGGMLWFKNISVHLCFYCQNNAFGLHRRSWMRCTVHLALLLKHFLCLILFLCHCCRLWPVCCFGAEIIEGEARMLERHSLRLRACKSLGFFPLVRKRQYSLFSSLQAAVFIFRLLACESLGTDEFPSFFFCSSSKLQTSRCCRMCKTFFQILQILAL